MIRPARRDDAEALRLVDLEVLRDGRGQVRGPEELATAASIAERVARSWEEGRGGTWVAEEDGDVVGEGALAVLGPSRCRHVASLALQVRPSAQGRGHGRALLDAVIARAVELGVHRLELYVRADNVRAIGLYRAAGFALESTRPRFVRLPDGGWADDHVMVRHLVGPYGEKACGLVVRGDRFLVLQHPLAGWQLPKGTMDPGETPAQAAVREVEEETGLAGLDIVRSLGWWTQYAPGGPLQRWHAFVLAAPPDVPDAWEHRATGSPEEDGLVFRLSFQPLAGTPWDAFHGSFHEALHRLVARRERAVYLPA